MSIPDEKRFSGYKCETRHLRAPVQSNRAWNVCHDPQTGRFRQFHVKTMEDPIAARSTEFLPPRVRPSHVVLRPPISKESASRSEFVDHAHSFRIVHMRG